MKRFSILQSEKKCFVCGTTYNIHTHEIFFGTANRKKSIKYGCCIYLCGYHHNLSNEGVHFNKKLDTYLKQIGQRAFEEKYPDKDFLKEFGRNYL